MTAHLRAREEGVGYDQDPMAPIEFADVQSVMDRLGPVGVGTMRRLAVTGEPYDHIVVVGSTEAETCAQFLAAIGQYLNEKPGVIYWRTRPSFTTDNTAIPGARYRIRARLLASETPAMEDAAAA